jgi:hypothetical protein
VHRPTASEGLVIAIGVDGESPDELAIVGDDADVWAGNQELDSEVFVSDADGDMAKLAEVAEGDLTAGIDLVLADAVVLGCWLASGLGLDAGVEDGDGSLSIKGPVWSLGVVVVAKGVELDLELGDRGRRGLLGEEALEGLVEAFDLAAGLGMVGGGVFEGDAEALEFQLQENLAPAGAGGEDSAVIAEQ